MGRSPSESRKKRVAGGAKPDRDCLRTRIWIAEHSITKVTRAAQPGLHLRCRFRAALRCFQRGEHRVRCCFQTCGLLQSLGEGIECIQHGAVARLCATQFADGLAALTQGFGPLRESSCADALKCTAATQKKHSIERSR